MAREHHIGGLPMPAATLALLLSTLCGGSGRLLLQTQDLLAPGNPLELVLSPNMTNEELKEHMVGFVERCGHIARLTAIGSSVQGFPLLVLEISDHPGAQEAKPNFRYIANQHGDETGGRQLLLALAEWLCANYQRSHVATRVVDEMHLYLLPSLNPDGYALGTRGNANGTDLNRDLPDPIQDGSLDPNGTEQPETRAFMDWALSKQFVAAANVHQGDVVAVYPFSGNVGGGAAYNATQDDATFRYLARTYVQHNPDMASTHDSLSDILEAEIFGDDEPVHTFSHGISNMAAWYSVFGATMDWSYLRAGCFEVGLELSFNRSTALPKDLFEDNLQSMLHLALAATLGGVHGRVMAQDGGPLPANITVGDSDFVTHAQLPFGDYYRPLAPGRYNMTVAAQGYATLVLRIDVPAVPPNEWPEGAVQDVRLVAVAGS